jgi:hypothetical protein
LSKKVKPFRCEECDKGFIDEISLWQHCLIKHPQRNMKKPKRVPPELSTDAEKIPEVVAPEEKP